MHADERRCPNCSAHGGSGGEASDCYDDLEPPPRAYSGNSRARYEPRDPRTRLAGPVHFGLRSSMVTDAWVADSLEARAQVAQVAGGATSVLFYTRKGRDKDVTRDNPKAKSDDIHTHWMAQQNHHGNLYQHTSQCSCSSATAVLHFFCMLSLQWSIPAGGSLVLLSFQL